MEMKIMTNKEKSLVEKCKNINLFDGRLLVAPHKLRQKKEKHVIPKTDGMTEEDIMGYTDEDGNFVEPKEVDSEVKEIKVNKRIQTATVLKVPEKFNFAAKDLHAGMTIYYNVGDIVEFDLIKGVSMLREHQILGASYE